MSVESKLIFPLESEMYQRILAIGIGIAPAVSAQCIWSGSSSSRSKCLAEAALSFDTKPKSIAELTRGPIDPILNKDEQRIACRFTFHPKKGTSPKFRCYAATPSGVYYSRDGVPVPAAESVSDKDYLLTSKTRANSRTRRQRTSSQKTTRQVHLGSISTPRSFHRSCLHPTVLGARILR